MQASNSRWICFNELINSQISERRHRLYLTDSLIEKGMQGSNRPKLVLCILVVSAGRSWESDMGEKVALDMPSEAWNKKPTSPIFCYLRFLPSFPLYTDSFTAMTKKFWSNQLLAACLFIWTWHSTLIRTKQKQLSDSSDHSNGLLMVTNHCLRGKDW